MIKIDILAEINSALAGIKTFQEKSNKLLDTMAKQGKSSFDTLVKATVFLNQGLELAGKAYNAFSGVVSAGIKASIQQEEAINDLNQALRSTGQLTAATSQDFQAFASSLQKTTTFGDEVTLKAAALGIQLGNLSGQQLKDATLASANLASALGIDLETAMRMITKASIDGGTGLRRYGIAVEKGATDSLTLSNAIAKVNEQFGGAAASKVNTYKGALTQANNSYGDMLEKIGDFIVKNPLVTKVINIASKAFNELEKIIAGLDPAPFNRLVADGVILLIDGLLLLTKSINPVISGFNALGALGSAIFDTLKLGANSVIAVFTSFTNIIATSLNYLLSLVPERFIPEGWKESMESFKIATDEALEAVTETTVEFANSAAENFTAIGESFVNTVSEEKLELIRSVLRSTQNEIAKAAKGTTATLVKENKVVVVDEQKAIKTRWELIKDFYADVQEQIRVTANYEKATSLQKVQNVNDALKQISSLTSSTNKELFAIGKAAAITTATIDGILAVQKTLANTPYPLNFILAGLVGTAAAVNVAKIASTQPPKFADGGIVGGNSFTGDAITARVNSGEMILNREQQASLFRQIKEGGDAGVVEAINRLGNRIANLEIVVKTDDIEIARSVRRALADGFALA